MMTSELRWVRWGALVALGLGCLGPRAARAEDGKAAPAGSAKQTPSARKNKPAVTVNLVALAEQLKSSDSAEVEKALGEAKAAGKGALPICPAVEDLLRRGTSPAIASLALGVLAEIGSPTSAAAIQPYLHHRSPETRKKALATLVKTGGPTAIGWLREALSDSDAGVRGIAASGLGTLKGREAIGDLFLALDHQVTEAAASIGQVCMGDECEKFSAKTGNLGLDVMTSGFDQILFRPSTEISDDQKIRVVERVRELGTQEANKYLRDVQSRWPAGTSPKVKLAIDQGVIATAGSRS
jgi:HEAT repeat protein